MIDNTTQNSKSNNEIFEAKIARGIKAYKNRASITALVELTPPAKNGYAKAQYYLGMMYHSGNGVDKNKETAIEWYTKALKGFEQLAEQGDVEAQYYLGMMYRSGNGVDKNKETAIEWYTKAAEQDHIWSQIKLSEIYADFKETADEWFKKSVKGLERLAEQGDAKAQFNLGMMYAFGHGTIKDEGIAVEWYIKAAKNGYAHAQYCLGEIYYYKRCIEIAIKWYRQAAEQGHKEAQFNLGEMYFYGWEGVIKKDEETAIEWCTHAADQGYKQAQELLEILAEEEGYAQAQYELGRMYDLEKMFKVCNKIFIENKELTVKWYQKAADQGHILAQYKLGYMYEYGRGLDKNINTAIEWYTKAAEQGHENAQEVLTNRGLSWNTEEDDDDLPF